MYRKCIIAILIAVLILSCSFSASAAEFEPNRKGSITVTLTEPKKGTPINGAKFDIYYIATVGINTNHRLSYAYTDTFRSCGIDLDDPDLAKKLSDYVVGKTITSKRITTNIAGKAECKDLALGLYLVKQAGSVGGYSTCSPFLVTVPMQGENSFTYDVNAAPKTDVVKLVNITIKKVWNTGKSGYTPSSVSVQLLNDGNVVKTATLNSSNNWQITYKDMPESDSYSIKEPNVPQGYTATYSKANYTFTVTNTSSLAQTGQHIWPIPVLAMAGLFFLAMGFVLLRKSED